MSASGDIIVAVNNKDTGIYYSHDRGNSWRESSSTLHDNYWAVAVSADGVKVVAVGGDPDDHIIGRIYTSVDAGVSFQRTSAPEIVWSGVASSADGNFLVATTWHGGIYYSRNAGNSWLKSSAPDDAAWTGVSMSADGTKLAACQNGGPVYLSNNGVTWSRTSMPYGQDRRFEDIAMSANGSQIVTVFYNSDGFIWLSDSGGSWWLTPGGPYDKYNRGITMSADGTKMAVASTTKNWIGSKNPDRISVSYDAGKSWRESNAPLLYWKAIASNDDMSRLVAASDDSDNSRIHVSTDYGLHFYETNSRYTTWTGVASSADGSFLAACIYNDRIWTSSDG